MNVLIVTGIFPPDHGGPATYVPSIAKGLHQLGHKIVAVVTLSDHLNHEDREYHFPVVRILRGRTKAVRWPQTIALIARLARHADVVYLNGLVLEGILATKVLCRRPVVVKVVGDLIWEKAQRSGSWRWSLDEFQKASLPLTIRFLRKLQGWYIAQADAVITPSHYLAKIVAGWGVHSSRIRVIYNAVSEPLADQSFPPTRYDLITVGRLAPWKGISELIEVASELKVTLRIAGDGPLREELEALARRRNAQVSFAGHVAHERIFHEIRSAKLFVLNSSYEGLPHVVLEAKAAGVAVLATAVGGTVETIHHGIDGWLVPVAEKAALEQAIRLLLNDDTLRTQLAEAGLRQVRTQFSAAAQLQMTETVLAEVCD